MAADPATRHRARPGRRHHHGAPALPARGRGAQPLLLLSPDGRGPGHERRRPALPARHGRRRIDPVQPDREEDAARTVEGGPHCQQQHWQDGPPRGGPDRLEARDLPGRAAGGVRGHPHAPRSAVDASSGRMSSRPGASGSTSATSTPSPLDRVGRRAWASLTPHGVGCLGRGGESAPEANGGSLGARPSFHAGVVRPPPRGDGSG